MKVAVLMNIEDFAAGLLTTVLRAEMDEGVSREEAFASDTLSVLRDNHEAFEPVPSYYRNARTHVNGFDFSIDRDECDVYVADFDANAGIRSISGTDLRRLCDQATEFVRRAIDGGLDDVEMDGPRQFIEALKEHASTLERIRVFVLTNRRAARNADNVLPSDVHVNGARTKVEYHVVDIDHLFLLDQASAPEEEIDIDFANDHSGALPALRFDYFDGRPYDLVLTLIPGQVLSDIYGKWRHRLLEQNVRAYLTARGGVNRGMRETIKDRPDMFAAYNNGLCATAKEAVVEVGLDGAPQLVRVLGFQIVNGGQTTASLFDAARLYDLAPIAVPMKLVVVKRQDAVSDLVREISKFTNSQNKVMGSDLGANDLFHRDLERESRTAIAPAPTGEIGTRWFYERVRNQYADERSRQATPAQRARWSRENPPRQKLTKTLVAKYELAWHQRPHIVCLGSEKNYPSFQAYRDEVNITVTSQYFRGIVARAILCQACDQIAKPLVTGWKTNIVVYAVAAFAHVHSARFDPIAVWERQSITPEIEQALRALVVMARDHLYATPVAGQNIGEWSKTVSSWEQFKSKLDKHYAAPPPIPDASGMTPVAPTSHAWIDRPELVTSAVWSQLAGWGDRTGNLTPRQKQACLELAAAASAGRRPHPNYYRIGSGAVRIAVDGGFELPPLT
jgi:hypothetical protein